MNIYRTVFKFVTSFFQFKCCGVSGPSSLPSYQSWKNNNEKHFKGPVVVPLSCCQTETDGCNTEAKIPATIYTDVS